MPEVTFRDVTRALARGVEVLIGVDANTPGVGDLHMARATYQEHDPSTGSVGACVCYLRIEQYDELRALGAVEDGRLG